MATLYIREYVGTGMVGNATGQGQAFLSTPAPVEPGLADQTVAISAGSTASSAFNAKTNLVRLHTDAICSIAFGATPTASATTARMAANQTEYFIVLPGQKVAVITNS